MFFHSPLDQTACELHTKGSDFLHGIIICTPGECWGTPATNNHLRRVGLLAQPSDNNWPAGVLVWARPLQGGGNETRPFKKKRRLTLQFWQVSLLPYHWGLTTPQLIVTSAHRKQDRIVTTNSSHVWSASYMPGDKGRFLMHCFIKAGHVLPSFTPKLTRVEYRVDGQPTRKIEIQDSKPLTSLFLVMTTTASLTLSPCLCHVCHFPKVSTV